MNSNDQKFMAQKIRTQYMEKDSTQLDALRALDAKVKRPANVFAGVLGTLSALVMGSGMSLVMTNIGETLGIADPMVPGIAIGVAGMVMAILTYPMYKGILNGRRKKYAAEIMRLSDEIVGVQ